MPVDKLEKLIVMMNNGKTDWDRMLSSPFFLAKREGLSEKKHSFHCTVISEDELMNRGWRSISWCFYPAVDFSSFILSKIDKMGNCF